MQTEHKETVTWVVSIWALLSRSKWQLLTITCQVHAAKHEGSNKLGLDVPFKVDEDCGEVSIWIVGYAGCRNGFDKLDIWELPCKSV